MADKKEDTLLRKQKRDKLIPLVIATTLAIALVFLLKVV